LPRSFCLPRRQGPIVDAKENRYYISLKGDLYLYVGPPKPENRFFLCTLERTNAGDKNT
jgi:hypothetical protein